MSTQISNPRPAPRSRVAFSGTLLTAVGLIGIVAGALFSIGAPQLRPVPVIFLGFWLVMVFVGKIFFTGLIRLREAGRSAPAPDQIRAAAAVAGVVIAIGLTGLAATGRDIGTAQAAPCPGGGPQTCGPNPTAPQMTFTPPAQQTTAPGQQPGQQGGQQDNNGIATSPAQGSSNDGSNIHAQTPEFGTPGQQAPTIPGNEPDQPPQQGTGPARATGQQQPPARTTNPAPPTPTTTPRRPQVETATSASTTSTRTPQATTRPDPNNETDRSNSDDDQSPPSWAYLVNEATALAAGRRLRSSNTALYSGQAVADTQTTFLRRTTGNRIIPGQIVDKPVTGTPTTGDGLPNPDPRTSQKMPMTPSQEQAYRNIVNTTPGEAAREWARSLWESMIGRRNPWYHDGRTITGTEKINADHIIPKRTLVNYIGFDTLPSSVQKSIADMPENIWPVPWRINQRNGDRPKTQWVGEDGKPLPPEILAEAIRRADAADKAIRSRILQELLKNQGSLIALLKQLGYSDEEIAAFMSMGNKSAILEQILNGKRPPLKVGTVPAKGKDGKELVPAPSKARPGEYQGQAGLLFEEPLSGSNRLRASDYLKDGWEPPAAVGAARDSALTALWVAFNNAGTQVSTPELNQAWHDWVAIDGVYQSLVQQHWQQSGRPGSAPRINPICVPANIPKV